jgi:hypothetical protein
MRIRRGLGRIRVVDVGPRSAHIAGLPYACFASADELTDAVPIVIAPRQGDPDNYLVLEAPEGRRFAVTVTCAANALGLVPPNSHAQGDGDAARLAFQVAGRWMSADAIALARRVLDIAANKVARVIDDSIREHGVQKPEMIGLGGGAGALVPQTAASLNLGWNIPPDAEVISSVGDALSMVRIELEKTLVNPDGAAIEALHRNVEAAAISAGANPSTVQVESEAVPERGALRVVAYGSLALESGSNESPLDPDEERELAQRVLGTAPLLIGRTPFYAVYGNQSTSQKRFIVVDKKGSVVVAASGTALIGTGVEVGAALAERVPALTRHFGPLKVGPAVRVIRGARLIDLTLISRPDEALEGALTECSLAGESSVIALLSRD